MTQNKERLQTAVYLKSEQVDLLHFLLEKAIHSGSWEADAAYEVGVAHPTLDKLKRAMEKFI